MGERAIADRGALNQPPYARAVRVLTVGNMYPPHDLRGGYELMWAAAVRELRSRGHRVRVLTADYEAPGRSTPAGEEAEIRRELRWYWHDHAFPRRGLAEVIELERHNARVLARELEGSAPT